MANADADNERILRERAQALARPQSSAPAPSTMLELLEFRLSVERYALEIRHVQDVHPLRELTPLPCTPPFVLGIVNVRGRILPSGKAGIAETSACRSSHRVPSSPGSNR